MKKLMFVVMFFVLIYCVSADLETFPLTIQVNSTTVVIHGGIQDITIPNTEFTFTESIILNTTTPMHYFPAFNETPICNLTCPVMPTIPACPNISVANITIIAQVNCTNMTPIIYNYTSGCPTQFTMPECQSCPVCPTLTCPEAPNYETKFQELKDLVQNNHNIETPQQVEVTPQTNSTSESKWFDLSNPNPFMLLGLICIAGIAYWKKDVLLGLLKKKEPEADVPESAPIVNENSKFAKLP